jgi:hypothetical protein
VGLHWLGAIVSTQVCKTTSAEKARTISICVLLLSTRKQGCIDFMSQKLDSWGALSAITVECNIFYSPEKNKTSIY